MGLEPGRKAEWKQTGQSLSQRCLTLCKTEEAGEGLSKLERFIICCQCHTGNRSGTPEFARSEQSVKSVWYYKYQI